MVAESSRSRESTTRVSRSPHWGQRIALLWLDHHYHLWCGTSIPLHGGQGRDWRAGGPLGWSVAAPRATGGLGVADDRLPGVDEVEASRLIDVWASTSRPRRRTWARIPRRGRPCRARARHARAPRRSRRGWDPRRRALQGAGLVGVAGDRVGRGLDGRTDRVGPELTPADGIDAAGCSVERLVDPAARSRTDDRKPSTSRVRATIRPARRARRGPQRQGDERGDGQHDRQVGDGHEGAHRINSSVPAARRGWRCPPRRDRRSRSCRRNPRWAHPDPFLQRSSTVCMPTLCWMAPLMPIAR